MKLFLVQRLSDFKYQTSKLIRREISLVSEVFLINEVPIVSVTIRTPYIECQPILRGNESGRV